MASSWTQSSRAQSSRRRGGDLEAMREWTHARTGRILGLLERRGAKLEIGATDIRRIARFFRVPNLPAAIVLQGWQEFRLKARHILFRSAENEQARGAYCAMRLHEFQRINARQAWANWRTIPRSIAGRLPNLPVLAIDLCCGIGCSTAVMAVYAAPRSEILGLEFNPAFVHAARQRQFPNDHCAPARVRFHAQSVLEGFCSRPGQTLPDGCADWINSSGAVGCHFTPRQTRTLAAEIHRVLKPGGLATIDSGPDGTTPGELLDIFQRLGFILLGKSKSCLLDRFTHVSMRKARG